MVCLYLRDVKIPICTRNMEKDEILVPDPRTLKQHCRSPWFSECERYPLPSIKEEIQRVFG